MTDFPLQLQMQGMAAKGYLFIHGIGATFIRADQIFKAHRPHLRRGSVQPRFDSCRVYASSQT